MFINAKDSFEALAQISIQLKNESEVLKEKANAVLPKPMQIGFMPGLDKYSIQIYNSHITLGSSSRWFNDFTYYSSGQNPIKTISELDKRKAQLLGLVDKLELDIIKVREDNKEALANNVKIRDKVTLMMKHIGIDMTYDTYEFKTSRARTKTKSTNRSGFMNDLDRVVKINYPNPTPDVESLRKKINEAYNSHLVVIRDSEKEKLKSEEKSKKEHELALLRAKYTPKDALSTKEDILEAILNLDKYLRLGHYLLSNRNDWNDGCDLASHGLHNFEVVSDIDKLIEENLSNIIDNWYDHLDGRIFRDCEYNYDVIFGMVENQDLIYDHEKIMAYFN